MASCLTLIKPNCKNCYKCIRHCAVKAIRFSGNQVHIISNECVLCGQCYVVCPQNAKRIVGETEKVKILLQSGEPVVVSLAPSFAAKYEGIGIGAMRAALQKLGFYDVEETAIGATIVKNEYERMLLEEERDVLISSSCHSINLLIQKHYTAALQYLADVISPMQAHCMDIKSRIPRARTVFIGPCVAKKDEADHYKGVVDAVLTFEELDRLLSEAHIEPEQEADAEEYSRARLFPVAGGIIKSMVQRAPGYTYISIDGVENCISALKDIIGGRIHKCFIEMSACVGGCAGGPVMKKHHHSSVRNYMTIQSFAGEKDFRVTPPSAPLLRKSFEPIEQKALQPSETEIRNMLRQMGKFNPSQELNCGSCGYDTCREKAIAICQGKAEIGMCLPSLKDRAERFSGTIVNSSPDGIIVLNERLVVQQINNAAREIMNMRSASYIIGDRVVRILDPLVFMQVRDNGRIVRNERVYLPAYKRYVDQTVVHDRESHLIICFMRDVTAEVTQREKKESIRKQTVETADRVIESQMRIVQEIAALLGETTAETKIALTKLKESISDE
ncbi:MAG: histidine kinase [Ruminococcaceae bacterium]|nr:histidine kinase [Oscillospiraceae bacterium]